MDFFQKHDHHEHLLRNGGNPANPKDWVVKVHPGQLKITDEVIEYDIHTKLEELEKSIGNLSIKQISDAIRFLAGQELQRRRDILEINPTLIIGENPV